MGEITKQEEIFCEQSVQGETHEKEPTLSGTRTGTPVTASVPGLTNTRTRFGSSGGLTDLGGAFSDGDGGGQGRENCNYMTRMRFFRTSNVDFAKMTHPTLALYYI